MDNYEPLSDVKKELTKVEAVCSLGEAKANVGLLTIILDSDNKITRRIQDTIYAGFAGIIVGFGKHCGILVGRLDNSETVHSPVQ